MTMYDEYRYEEYPDDVYDALMSFTDHLPEEERRETAERMCRYSKPTIEQVSNDLFLSYRFKRSDPQCTQIIANNSRNCSGHKTHHLIEL